LAADSITAPSNESFFSKLKSRLNAGKSWFSGGLFGKPLAEDSLEELETRLLTADVGIDATVWLLEHIKKRAAQKQHAGDSVLSLLEATVGDLLSPLERPIQIGGDAHPYVILVVGVNGTGKTTTIGKLAHRLNGEGRSVLLAAGDTFRAAAVEQLQAWGERAGCPVVAQATGADPAAVVHDAVAAAKARDVDVVIADTAGRLHTSAGLMDELKKIKRVISRFDPAAPHEVLLVLDASQGQNALAQARQFHESLGVTGLAITKLDGTAKGGILLAIGLELRLPIRYAAVGEGIEDFGPFRAADFARALVGDDRA
jgi:fused signal recognition particle receptor